VCKINEKGAFFLSTSTHHAHKRINIALREWQIYGIGKWESRKEGTFYFFILTLETVFFLFEMASHCLTRLVCARKESKWGRAKGKYPLCRYSGRPPDQNLRQDYRLPESNATKTHKEVARS